MGWIFCNSVFSHLDEDTILTVMNAITNQIANTAGVNLHTSPLQATHTTLYVQYSIKKTKLYRQYQLTDALSVKKKIADTPKVCFCLFIRWFTEIRQFKHFLEREEQSYKIFTLRWLSYICEGSMWKVILCITLNKNHTHTPLITKDILSSINTCSMIWNPVNIFHDGGSTFIKPSVAASKDLQHSPWSRRGHTCSLWDGLMFAK